MTEIRILPLAHTPKDRTEIIDWQPFEGGDSLGKIVSRHNAECEKTCAELGWPPEYITGILDRIDIVRHDLNDLGKLSSDDFETIEIIFADLDAVREKPKELGYVRAYMGRKPKRYYLLQISKRPDPQSLTGFFSGLPISPVPVEPPQLLGSQQEFEKFLGLYGVYLPYGFGLAGIENFLPPAALGTANRIEKQDYVDAVAKAKSEVRHAAIERNLTTGESISLARLAVQQELALKSIERVIRESPYEHIILNSIRKPVLEIAVEPFQELDFKPVELFEVRPSRSLWDISPQQRGILHQLGIKNETYTAVNAYSHNTLGLLNSLGDCVKVNRFSANLPAFKFKI